MITRPGQRKPYIKSYPADEECLFSVTDSLRRRLRLRQPKEQISRRWRDGDAIRAVAG